MATIPMTNKQVRVLPKANKKENQKWVPLSTEAGVILRSDGTRCLVSDSVAAIMEEHLTSSPNATFAVLEHGIRAIADGVTGQGGRFFIEARGSGLSELYLFGCGEKAEAFKEAMPEGSVQGLRVENKGGLYATVADGPGVAGAFLNFTKLHGSNRSPEDYRADMGAPETLETVEAVAEGTGVLEKQKRGPKPKEKGPEQEQQAAPDGKKQKRNKREVAAA